MKVLALENIGLNITKDNIYEANILEDGYLVEDNNKDVLKFDKNMFGIMVIQESEENNGR